MKIFEEKCPFEIQNAPDGALFLDIETTGLSAERSQLYLFGCMFRSGDSWTLRQWLLESPFEERSALREICEFVRGFDVLVHFNGEAFDLPYLNAHALSRELDPPFLSMPSLDLYKSLRCCKKLFGMPGCRQKDFEVFIGIDREDQYDGGRLIEVYRNYCKTGDEELLRLLLLHNREDVLNMGRIHALLPFADFYDPGAQLIAGPPRLFNREKALTGTDSEALLIFDLGRTYPVTVSSHTDGFYLTIEGSALRLLAPLFDGELRHFFYPPSDYYYLPAEDMAIHKSVATYVDPAHRVKATAENCYIKRAGTFVPILGAQWRELYYDRAGGSRYALLSDELLSGTVLWNGLLHDIMDRIRRN